MVARQPAAGHLVRVRARARARVRARARAGVRVRARTRVRARVSSTRPRETGRTAMHGESRRTSLS